MSVNIFRAINKEATASKIRLLEFNEYDEDSNEKQLEERRYNLLKQIAQYIKSYEWLSHKRSIEKVDVFIKNGFDYKKTCEQLGIELKSLEQAVSYASKTLEKKLDKGLLKLIREGRLEDAEKQFEVVTSRVSTSNIFPKGVLENMPEANRDSALLLENCLEELEFINLFTTKNIEKVVDTKSKNKLAHLLYILSSNDSKYAHERVLIFKYLNGDIETTEEILEELQDNNIFLQ